MDADRALDIAVVGGGILGLTLALRLASDGARVTVYEAQAELGGLSVPRQYGDFEWDRFYHCILPADAELRALLDEIGLSSELVWRRTHAGVLMEGVVRPLDGPGDLLRLPRLSLLSKLRIGVLAALAPRRRAPAELDRISAATWLRRWCGQSGYEGFWRHLLRAKLGSAAERVSARFMHATISRLASARSRSGSAERLGYVRGGYRRILEELRNALVGARVRFKTGEPVEQIERWGGGVRVAVASGRELHDAVALTVPSPVIARTVQGLVAADAERMADTAYLGVACTVAIAHAPLTRNYLLNICDDDYSITGVVEMSNLVSAETETAGKVLVYLPRYALADDPVFSESDDSIAATALRDLGRMFPQTCDGWARHVEVHRARFIQPVPLAGMPAFTPPVRPIADAPIFIANSAQLPSCVLNNNDCVALARRASREILENLVRERAIELAS